VPQRRRVLAMKKVQERYDALHRDYLAELAGLQAKYGSKYGEPARLGLHCSAARRALVARSLSSLPHGTAQHLTETQLALACNMCKRSPLSEVAERKLSHRPLPAAQLAPRVATCGLTGPAAAHCLCSATLRRATRAPSRPPASDGYL
jgi:hypothetical protein